MSSDRADESWMEDRPGRGGRYAYIAAWIVAVIVFELTANPTLVVVVGCSKFGWEQVRTAFWFPRIDPDRNRGNACRWLYLSWGFWRISIVATILMFTIVFVLQGLRQVLGAPVKAGDSPPFQFIVAFLVALLGFTISTYTTLIGLISAWRKRVRVWVGPEAIAAHAARRWPPTGYTGRVNKVHGLAITALPLSLIVIVIPAVGFASAACFGLLRGMWGQVAAAPATWIVCMTASLICSVVGFVGIMMMVDAAKTRIAATSPADCWPLGQDATPPSSNQST